MIVGEEKTRGRESGSGRQGRSPAGVRSSSSSESGSAAQGTADRLLKYVVNPVAYERLKADSDVTDPLTASGLMVSQNQNIVHGPR